MWKPQFLTGTNESSAELFTHKLLNHYTPDGNTQFNLAASSYPVFSDKQHLIHNDSMRFFEWPKYINDAALRSSRAYQTNHSIFMYGDDFSHPKAWSSY